MRVAEREERSPATSERFRMRQMNMGTMMMMMMMLMVMVMVLKVITAVRLNMMVTVMVMIMSMMMMSGQRQRRRRRKWRQMRRRRKIASNIKRNCCARQLRFKGYQKINGESDSQNATRVNTSLEALLTPCESAAEYVGRRAPCFVLTAASSFTSTNAGKNFMTVLTPGPNRQYK